MADAATSRLIQEAMDRRGLNGPALAGLIGCATQTAYNWRSGTLPRRRDVPLISKALGITQRALVAAIDADKATRRKVARAAAGTRP